MIVVFTVIGMSWDIMPMMAMMMVMMTIMSDDDNDYDDNLDATYSTTLLPPSICDPTGTYKHRVTPIIFPTLVLPP